MSRSRRKPNPNEDDALDETSGDQQTWRIARRACGLRDGDWSQMHSRGKTTWYENVQAVVEAMKDAC